MGEKWIKNHPEKYAAMIKKYRAEHKEDMRGFHLRRTYNISLEEYNQIFAEQNGKCAICGKHQSEIKISLYVDHCHNTGRIRGLLCPSCNFGLGYFQDDIENLKCAILYLNK